MTEPLIGQCIHCGASLTIGHSCFKRSLEGALQEAGLHVDVPALRAVLGDHNASASLRDPLLQERPGAPDRSPGYADGTRASPPSAQGPPRNKAPRLPLLGRNPDDLTKEQLEQRFDQAAHNVAELASDLFLASKDPAFALLCGGLGALFLKTQSAVKLWEKCMDDAYERDCRDMPG